MIARINHREKDFPTQFPKSSEKKGLKVFQESERLKNEMWFTGFKDSFSRIKEHTFENIHYRKTVNDDRGNKM